MMCDQFSCDNIFLIKKPVSGRYGAPRILSMLLGGCFEIPYIKDNLQELYIVLFTKNRKLMFVFHTDFFGHDLTKRRLCEGRFKIQLEESYNPEKISRDQLKRLLIDGTYQDEWNDVSLQKQFEQYARAQPMPNPT